MFNVRPDALSPWLHVEPPPANDPPGFRVAPDGAMPDSQSGLAFTPFRTIPASMPPHLIPPISRMQFAVPPVASTLKLT